MSSVVNRARALTSKTRTRGSKNPFASVAATLRKWKSELVAPASAGAQVVSAAAPDAGAFTKVDSSSFRVDFTKDDFSAAGGASARCLWPPPPLGRGYAHRDAE